MYDYNNGSNNESRGSAADKFFWVDFTGSMRVRANSVEEAKELFLETVPSNVEFVEIDYVEEAGEAGK